MTTRAMAGQGNSGRSLDQQPWIGRYSHHEMARMQKEDLDLAPVYNWLQMRNKCSRDESSQYSPATRRLWLNWENLLWKMALYTRDGCLLQKHYNY